MTKNNKPDWDFWGEQTLVNLKCAVALSLDFEPQLDKELRTTINTRCLFHFDGQSEVPEYFDRLTVAGMWVKKGLLVSAGRQVDTLRDASTQRVLLKDFTMLCIESRMTIPTELHALVSDVPRAKTDRDKPTAERNIKIMKRRTELIAENHPSVAKEIAREFSMETKTVTNIITRLKK